MRSYSQWKENSAYTAAYVHGNSDSSGYPSQIFSHQKQQDSNGSNPSIFNSFKKWYDDSRGPWNHVELAISRSPELAELIRTAEQAFAKQGSTHAVYSFNNKTYKGFGSLGDEIEQMVKQINPDHGYNKDLRHYEPGNIMRSNSNHAMGNSSTSVFGGSGQRSFIQYLQNLDGRVSALEKKIGGI